jgi:hypothetical protein
VKLKIQSSPTFHSLVISGCKHQPTHTKHHLSIPEFLDRIGSTPTPTLKKKSKECREIDQCAPPIGSTQPRLLLPDSSKKSYISCDRIITDKFSWRNITLRKEKAGSRTAHRTCPYLLENDKKPREGRPPPWRRRRAWRRTELRSNRHGLARALIDDSRKSRVVVGQEIEVGDRDQRRAAAAASQIRLAAGGHR